MMRLRKRQESNATPQELAVARALLGRGRRADALLAQLVTSPKMERAITANRLALAVQSWVDEDLLIELDVDVVGDWQHVRLVEPLGLAVEFRVALARGGFFERLEGRAPDGIPWPREWQPDPASLSRVHPLQIPSTECPCDAVLHWAKIQTSDVAKSEALRCRRPADTSAIKAVEQRESAALPSDYVELLRRTDGIHTSRMLVFGAADLFVTRLGTERFWVVGAVGTGEAFVVVKVDERPRYLLIDHEAPVAEAAAIGDHAACLVQLAIEVGESESSNGAVSVKDHC